MIKVNIKNTNILIRDEPLLPGFCPSSPSILSRTRPRAKAGRDSGGDGDFNINIGYVFRQREENRCLIENI
jgi:hypothetical protein